MGAALLAGALPAGAAKVYCCQDDRGRRICGDVLPAQCEGKAYREMVPGGRSVEHAAPLSAAERARIAAEEQARKEEAERLAAERVRNQALLESYGDASDIDRRRDREVAEIERTIVISQEQLAELSKRRARFQQDLEFYKGQPLPAEMERQQEALDKEEKSLLDSIERRRKEQESIRSKYADERKRYDALRAERDGTAAAKPAR